MQQDVIIIIVILTVAVFLYTSLCANRLIGQLKQQMPIPNHWSGRMNVKELRIAYNTTKEPSQQRLITKAISLLNISKVVVYVSFTLVVLIMLFWK